MLSAKCSLLWLTALPIQEQGFICKNKNFKMHYDWGMGEKLSRVPSHCICGALFSMDHAMICHHDGLTFIHHNELGNLTASWLHEVYHDMACEPPLQLLTGEALVPESANCRDDARVAIHARDFWGRCQGPFYRFFQNSCFIECWEISWYRQKHS